MKPSPADHRTADIHECFMDVIPLVESSAQSSELMQQCLGLLDHVSEDAQTAAVRLAASSDRGGDAATREFHASMIVVIGAVAHDCLGLTQRRTGLAMNRRDRIHQRDQLRDVVGVGGGQDVG